MKRLLVAIVLVAGCKKSAFIQSPAPLSEGLGVIFLGDTGKPGEPQTAVANAIVQFCQTNSCDRGLLLGDNFYPMGVWHVNDKAWQEKFEKPYKNVPFKFYAILGNHDTWGNSGAQIAYKSSKWSMPSEWYAAYQGPAKFVALNTNGLTFPKEQKNWLESILVSEYNGWKIVYGHHPIFSTGDHGDTYHLKADIKPLLDKYKADFYLSGHDHDKELIEKDGVKYAVCGAGSKKRPVKGGKHTVYAGESYGFCHLYLTATSATISFIDENGITEFKKEYLK